MLNYENIVKEKMSKKRFIHSLNVSQVAKKLAQAYRADEKKAEIAGLLHDITKEMPEDEQLKLFDSEGIVLDDVERSTTKLWHSISGEIYVKKYLNIQDADILNAIRYHTTARSNMSLLEKIIVMSDFISEDRQYDNVEYMRSLAFENLDKAIIYGLKIQMEFLFEQDKPIAVNMLKAYNDIILKMRKSEGTV